MPSFKRDLLTYAVLSIVKNRILALPEEIFDNCKVLSVLKVDDNKISECVYVRERESERVCVRERVRECLKERGETMRSDRRVYV